MTEKIENQSGARGEENTGVNPSERRLPRSIRYSDSEWRSIEKVARGRGMSTAELVRHVSVGFAKGILSATPSGNLPTSLPEITTQVERIYNGVYLLATLKRDEMLGNGQKELLEKIIEDARKSKELFQGNSSD